MKKINLLRLISFVGIFISVASCTDLNEEILDSTDIKSADPDAILNSAYNGLRSFQNQDGAYALSEVSTDALIVPTRGGDWDDGGAWREDHLHTWNASSREGNASWNNLLSSVNNCDIALSISGISPNKKAQALFLKAYFYYNVIDLFGKAPYRPAGSSPEDFPLVWNSTEALNNIISWLEEALPNIPARNSNDPSIANKDAVHFLLAKCYLNKAVFIDSDRIGPFAHSASDMTKVIENVDAITNTLANDYWDNFKPSNNTSPELILTSKNILGVALGNVRSRWYMGAHYNQRPGGWNGFSVLGDYYDSFNPNDRRIFNNDSSIISAFGNPWGMQIGQQFATDGTPLNDRNGNPLVFTKEITITTGGATLETAGIRPQKYIPDNSNIDRPENDYVLMRYADALLMKAEAILRGGVGSLGTIQTDLSSRNGITTPIDLSSLNGVYVARGQELWAEGWRRNDMIRFGTYLDARPTKPLSENKRVLMPIPSAALSNPNLTQNLGYN